MARPTFINAAAMVQLLLNGRRSAAGENIDPLPVLKLFTPDGAATWLITEIDPQVPDQAFGLCDLGLGSPELGYVSLDELAAGRGGLNLPVEADAAFEPCQPLSAYADAARAAGQIVYPTDEDAARERTFVVGQRVFFWTGRGSHGLGRIRKITADRAFIDPDPDAVKGSDFRTFAPGSKRRDVWIPRDHGVPLRKLNSPKRVWWMGL